MRALVTAKEQLSADLIKLTLTYDEAQPHRSGQYSVVSLPGVEGKGYFSIASSASQQPSMTFLIRLGASPLDQALSDLSIGDGVDAALPAGTFMPAKDGDTLIFAAGGTGIAPLLAMLTQLVMDEDQRQLRLIYGIRSIDELGFENELQALSRAGVVVDIVISAPISLPADLGPTKGQRLHLCGPKAMIEALTQQAADLGIERVYTEPY